MSWRDKHECVACGTGYGCCAQGWTLSLMCCAQCDHPGRLGADPWTAEDIREMWEGKEMPRHVVECLRRLAHTD